LWAIVIRRTEAMASMPTALESTIVMAVITAVTGATSLCDHFASRASWRTRAWVAWLGVSDAFNVLLFFAAYKITIAIAVLAHYLTPIFVAILAPFVLRERVTRRTVAAVVTSFAGLTLLLASSQSAANGSAAFQSAALGAGSAVFYASNVIVNKFVAHTFSTSETMFWHGIVATPLLAAFVPRDAWAAVDTRAAAFLAIASVGPGALAGLAFVWGLRRMPAAHASTLTLLEPLVAVLTGAALFKEALGWRTLVGGALILSGALAVVSRGARR